MIIIKDKKDCCGCGACVQKCPKKCISLQEDNEGFLYPYIDEKLCVDCGLCEKVCPETSSYDTRLPFRSYAAINTNDEIRKLSSSGGIFSVIAEKIIDEGGVVFGARFDESWQVILDYTENKDGIKAFRGSKYIQAYTGETFSECEYFLKEGRKVLYTGTPCQIAALKHFLRKDYSNLLTIDFICHGVPSPLVWRRYLNDISKIESIKSICKGVGTSALKDFRFKVEYDSKDSILSFSSLAHENAYLKAFLSDLILRPSCHSCIAKSCSSMSDMTIADFWGVWNVEPTFFDDKGTSLVLIHNQNLEGILYGIEGIKMQEVSYEKAIKFNMALIDNATPNINRDLFWQKFHKTKNFSRLVSRCTTPTGIIAIKRFIKKIINYLKGDNQELHKYFNYNNIEGCKIHKISFREKRNSWSKYQFKIDFHISFKH